jgi:uncharacterized protein YdeI (BOF family)
MNDEIMNYEERGFKDKLDFFYVEKVKVHVVLKKRLKNGKRVWLNGFVTKKLTDRLYSFKDRELGVVRLALSEIFDVEEFKEGDNGKP